MVVFGVPLQKLLEQDRAKYPHLKVPKVVHEALRIITRSGKAIRSTTK